MKQILTTSALALVLLATASGAAMAQERHERSGGQSAQPEGHPGGGHPAGPPGGGHFEGGHPGGPPGGFHEGRAPGGEPHGPPAGMRPEGRGASERFQGGPPADRFQGPARSEPSRGGPSAAFRHEGAPMQGAGPRPGGRPPGHFEAWGGRPGGPPPHWSSGHYPAVMNWRYDRFHAGFYRSPPGYYYRAWGFGDFLPRPWFVRSYWLTDFLSFGLPYPPPGFVWVRVGPDALLIDEYSGRIVQVVRTIFW